MRDKYEFLGYRYLDCIKEEDVFHEIIIGTDICRYTCDNIDRLKVLVSTLYIHLVATKKIKVPNLKETKDEISWSFNEIDDISDFVIDLFSITNKDEKNKVVYTTVKIITMIESNFHTSESLNNSFVNSLRSLGYNISYDSNTKKYSMCIKKRKYILTNEAITREGTTLHRIKALKDFGDVKKGQLGGFIESKENLSHEGNCWVYDDACVYGNAKIYNNVRISGNARVYGNANIEGNSKVCGNIKVCENAHICENAQVSGNNALVFGNTKVFGNAYVYGDAKVYGNAELYGDIKVSGNTYVCENAKVYGYAQVYENAKICGNAELYEDAKVFGNTYVSRNAKVFGNAYVYGDAKLCGTADISKNSDYAIIKGFGTNYRTTTFFRCKDNEIRVSCGCFYGTIPEFRKQVKDTRKGKIAKEYLLIADLMEEHFK